MRDREPLVSVILPTFNREAYVREAVQRGNRALGAHPHDHAR
jgi:hypothetical protein